MYRYLLLIPVALLVVGVGMVPFTNARHDEYQRNRPPAFVPTPVEMDCHDTAQGEHLLALTNARRYTGGSGDLVMYNRTAEDYFFFVEVCERERDYRDCRTYEKVLPPQQETALHLTGLVTGAPRIGSVPFRVRPITRVCRPRTL
jgi:hypothetical protein